MDWVHIQALAAKLRKRKLHSLTLEVSNLLVDDKVKETLIVLLFNRYLWCNRR